MKGSYCKTHKESKLSITIEKKLSPKPNLEEEFSRSLYYTPKQEEQLQEQEESPEFEYFNRLKFGEENESKEDLLQKLNEVKVENEQLKLKLVRRSEVMMDQTELMQNLRQESENKYKKLLKDQDAQTQEWYKQVQKLCDKIKRLQRKLNDKQKKIVKLEELY